MHLLQEIFTWKDTGSEHDSEACNVTNAGPTGRQVQDEHRESDAFAKGCRAMMQIM